jgi:hypothetical protein
VLGQVGQRGLIQGVGIVPGTEQFQEIDPALAVGAREPGEAFVADMRTVSILALMARTPYRPHERTGCVAVLLPATRLSRDGTRYGRR